MEIKRVRRRGKETDKQEAKMGENRRHKQERRKDNRKNSERKG